MECPFEVLLEELLPDLENTVPAMQERLSERDETVSSACKR